MYIIVWKQTAFGHSATQLIPHSSPTIRFETASPQNTFYILVLSHAHRNLYNGPRILQVLTVRSRINWKLVWDATFLWMHILCFRHHWFCNRGTSRCMWKAVRICRGRLALHIIRNANPLSPQLQKSTQQFTRFTDWLMDGRWWWADDGYVC